MKPADIILQQLGGRQFVLCTGARNIFSADNGKTLMVDFPNRMRSKPNHVRITLTGRDDYDITFMRKRTKKGFPEIKVLKKLEGIYWDQLQDLFEEETGLYVTLQPRR